MTIIQKNHNTSHDYYTEALDMIPGGVNSPVRAFGSVGTNPIFIESAQGAYITDVDGNTYIDYVCSWGPMILGHSSKIALEGVAEALLRGTSYGMPTHIEVTMAKRIQSMFPSIEMVRMVSSGTEATMSAIRLARAYTKKDKIIKFQGCYHGHSDGLLVKSGSGTLTQGVPTSEGIPLSIIQHTLVADFNDLGSVETLITTYKDQIAAIIIEPIPGNMGLIEAGKGFLEGLRALTTREGILLIFDEVISGFRIHPSGAQGYYKVIPDITCLGKIIGGGMPVGAYGGRKEIMEMIAPLGPVYQAGTLSGNPIAMLMGLNVLNYLKKTPTVYSYMTTLAQGLEEGFKKNIKDLGLENITINRVGNMVCQFFAKGPIETYDQVMASDTELYGVYFRSMLEQGILLPPAQYEILFLSEAHSMKDIKKTIECHLQAMKEVSQSCP